jgi:hypothetical protein
MHFFTVLNSIKNEKELFANEGKQSQTNPSGMGKRFTLQFFLFLSLLLFSLYACSCTPYNQKFAYQKRVSSKAFHTNGPLMDNI